MKTKENTYIITFSRISEYIDEEQNLVYDIRRTEILHPKIEEIFNLVNNQKDNRKKELLISGMNMIFFADICNSIEELSLFSYDVDSSTNKIKKTIVFKELKLKKAWR